MEYIEGLLTGDRLGRETPAESFWAKLATQDSHSQVHRSCPELDKKPVLIEGTGDSAANESVGLESKSISELVIVLMDVFCVPYSGGLRNGDFLCAGGIGSSSEKTEEWTSKSIQLIS